MTTDFEPTPTPSAGLPIEENAPGGPLHNVPLGTLVLQAGLMPLEEIDRALNDAVTHGRRLGDLLLERGLEERDLVRLLAAQQAEPFVDLSSFPIDRGAVQLLPETAATTYCALPIGFSGEAVLIAVPAADNAVQAERLETALDRPIRLLTAVRSEIKAAIERLYAAPAAPHVVDEPESNEFIVVLDLSSGERIELLALTDRAAAEAVASSLAHEAAERGSWPAGRGRLVPNAEIVAFGLIERESG